jgi:O-antigen/teichoic acid export membrane protein
MAGLSLQPGVMRQTFVRAARLLTLFAAAFGIGMTLIGGVLIRLTYDPRGTQFVGAALVLTILSWSLIPTLLKGVTTLYLYAQKREHYVNGVMGGALVAQGILGYIFIGRWGAPGAALTVVVVEGGSLLCLWYGLRIRRAAYVSL